MIHHPIPTIRVSFFNNSRNPSIVETFRPLPASIPAHRTPSSQPITEISVISGSDTPQQHPHNLLHPLPLDRLPQPLPYLPTSDRNRQPLIPLPQIRQLPLNTRSSLPTRIRHRHMRRIGTIDLLQRVCTVSVGTVPIVDHLAELSDIEPTQDQQSNPYIVTLPRSGPFS